jgi:hypothetical protein
MRFSELPKEAQSIVKKTPLRAITINDHAVEPAPAQGARFP